ncbi:hypothetical protein CLCR_07789 [Cladophialophora carrionii]|uniref:Uncharacterized protein n=1 Tax=Cladophialophora carrionii TaxID=86049 RepID=A0A1C1CQS8_9EURO|nr:hypothetical protein CLCR_07789 [Cladophialophora carrionii]
MALGKSGKFGRLLVDFLSEEHSDEAGAVVHAGIFLEPGRSVCIRRYGALLRVHYADMHRDKMGCFMTDESLNARQDFHFLKRSRVARHKLELRDVAKSAPIMHEQ